MPISYLAEKQKAFDFANRAVPLAETAVKDSSDDKRANALKVQAWALDTLGRAHNEFGDRKKAVEIFNQALSIRRQINDRPGLIVTLEQSRNYVSKHGRTAKGAGVSD